MVLHAIVFVCGAGSRKFPWGSQFGQIEFHSAAPCGNGGDLLTPGDGGG